MRRVLYLVASVVVFSITSAAHANPSPSGFPNLDDYVSVDADEYERTVGHEVLAVVFVPASGNYSCNFSVGGYPPPAAPGVGTPECHGDIPGADDATATDDVSDGCFFVQILPGTSQHPGGAVYRSHSSCKPYASGAAQAPRIELPPGHKVTVKTVTCAQGEGDNTACLDTRNGGHGFVISPERSWTF